MRRSSISVLGATHRAVSVQANGDVVGLRPMHVLSQGPLLIGTAIGRAQGATVIADSGAMRTPGPSPQIAGSVRLTSGEFGWIVC